MDETSAFTPTGPYLGAHEMGIGQSSTLPRPSLMVTSPSENDNSQPSQQQQQQQQHSYYDYPTTSSANPSSSAADSKELDKKKPGFAAAFKRKFQRKPKSRSMSADRTGSLKEGAHLQPPIQHGRQPEVTEVPENGLRQKRSRSFSSSIRRLFKGKKKDGAEGGASGRSRESSLSRHSTRSAQGALTFDVSPAYNGPPRGELNGNSRDERQESPDINDYPYSSSVPAKTSPIYGQQFYTGHS